MYVDFHKYNYDLVDLSQREDYEKRDKEAYQKILEKWVQDNLEKIAERRWEIKEIKYLSEVSDFIKLIREAESLYELGFYTSCIALVGVSAEDFSKYLSLKLGKHHHITTKSKKGRTLDVSQHDRLQGQLTEKIIDRTVYDLLDRIRVTRNDCLHFNQDFKKKSDNDLKSDAIETLNNLKSVLKEILEITEEISPENFLKVIGLLSMPSNESAKNFDETKMRLRNAISHLLSLPTAFEPGKEIVVIDDYYLIDDVDFDSDEISLTSILKPPGAHVIVELENSVKDHIRRLKFKEKDIISAVIFSQPNQFGMTEEWHFYDLRRADNFGEMFHEVIEIMKKSIF
jgi:hypothetical protein